MSISGDPTAARASAVALSELATAIAAPGSVSPEPGTAAALRAVLDLLCVVTGAEHAHLTVSGAGRPVTTAWAASGPMTPDQLASPQAVRIPVVPAPFGTEHASLELWAERPIATPEPAVTALVSIAASALALRARNANLAIALDSAREIGAAIGILMAIDHLTYELAFDRLRAASQTSGRKLRDIAAQVVLTGAAPV